MFIVLIKRGVFKQRRPQCLLNPVLKLCIPVLQYILLLFRFKKRAYKLMLAECLIYTVFHTHLYDSLSTLSAYIYIPSITSETA